MLTIKEKTECYRLVSKLTDCELFSLKDTVTRKQITALDRYDAIRAVVEYSENAVELLRRKKLKRDILFQYLTDCGIVAPVSAEKHELILRVLQFWGTALPAIKDLSDIDADGDSSLRQPDPTLPFITGSSSNPTADHPSPSSTNVAHQSASSIYHNESIENTHLQELGEAFVRWFYDQLNLQNPMTGGQSGEFGPQHFWDNCSLKLVCRTPELTEEIFDGSHLVANRLRALMQEELLVLNPNVCRDGVRVASQAHGLLAVQVCGTVSQYNKLIGVFQQLFGLARASAGHDTWKVKFSELHLSSSGNLTVPRLTDFSETEHSESSLTLVNTV